MENKAILQELLDHPRIALFLSLIATGITRSGKFSITTTRICFFIAWLSATYYLYGYSQLRSKPLTTVCFSLAIGIGLFMLGAWIRPEVLPQSFGVLTPRRKLIFSNVKNVHPVIEIGDSGAKLAWAGPDGEPIIKFGNATLTIELIKNKVRVSTQIMDAGGRLVAEITRNE